MMREPTSFTQHPAFNIQQTNDPPIQQSDLSTTQQPRAESLDSRRNCGLRLAESFATYQPAEMTTNQLAWYVAHTRPRCEKKLAEYCEREGFLVTLPCYRTVHKYRGKTVAFRKPLFPGYVFLQLQQPQRQKLETELEVILAPQITAGARVKIKAGPLRGMEGWVQERAGVTMVLLRLDFISQAAAVKIEATELEIV